MFIMLCYVTVHTTEPLKTELLNPPQNSSVSRVVLLPIRLPSQILVLDQTYWTLAFSYMCQIKQITLSFSVHVKLVLLYHIVSEVELVLHILLMLIHVHEKHCDMYVYSPSNTDIIQ